MHETMKMLTTSETTIAHKFHTAPQYAHDHTTNAYQLTNDIRKNMFANIMLNESTIDMHSSAVHQAMVNFMSIINPPSQPPHISLTGNTNLIMLRTTLHNRLMRTRDALVRDQPYAYALLLPHYVFTLLKNDPSHPFRSTMACVHVRDDEGEGGDDSHPENNNHPRDDHHSGGDGHSGSDENAGTVETNRLRELEDVDACESECGSDDHHSSEPQDSNSDSDSDDPANDGDTSAVKSENRNALNKQDAAGSQKDDEKSLEDSVISANNVITRTNTLEVVKYYDVLTLFQQRAQQSQEADAEAYAHVSHIHAPSFCSVEHVLVTLVQSACLQEHELERLVTNILITDKITHKTCTNVEPLTNITQVLYKYVTNVINLYRSFQSDSNRVSDLKNALKVCAIVTALIAITSRRMTLHITEQLCIESIYNLYHHNNIRYWDILIRRHCNA